MEHTNICVGDTVTTNEGVVGVVERFTLEFPTKTKMVQIRIDSGAVRLFRLDCVNIVSKYQ